MVAWDYFDKYEQVIDKYMPRMGEGDNQASQIVTAVNKLIYKWYNDGDVYDNTGYLSGWANDLSCYANWLYQHTIAVPVLESIAECYNDDDYEQLLKELADELLDEEWLYFMSHQPKVGSIYECDGPFKFVDECDEDDYEFEEEYGYDDEEEYEDD